MKVFLSSTYKDLVGHRQAAVDAIERLGQQAARMEVFGARSEEPVTASLRAVAECDLFVGIYAHRYGFVPAGSAVSITEAEFDHARKHNKLILCFVVDEEHPWPPKLIEDGPGMASLLAFKAKVSAGVVRDRFTTPEDLALKLATAIGRCLSQRAPAIKEENPYLQRFRGCGDLEDLLENALRELEAVTRTDYNQIFLRCTSAYAQQLVAVADAIPPHKQRYRVASLTGLLASVFTTGRALNAADVRERRGYFQAVPATRSELVVPVVVGTAVLGVLNSESEVVRHFSDDMCRRVERLGRALGELLPVFGWSPSLSLGQAPSITRRPAGDYEPGDAAGGPRGRC